MLASIFQDNMMIQAGRPFRVWGSGAPGERVEIEVEGPCARRGSGVCGADGRFCLEFEGISASVEPYEISAGGQRIRNLLFGEVFLCAGQSNMELPTEYLDDGRILGSCKNSQIRILKLANAHPSPDGPAYDERPFDPQEEIGEGLYWSEATPESVAKFSVIGYLFAKKLSASLGVPVGVIDVSVGAALFQTYLPPDALDRDPEIRRFLDENGYEYRRETYNKAGGMNFTQVCGMYNEKLHPLRHFSFRAFCWYQGESEILTRAGQHVYERALRLLFGSMRRVFGEELPIFAFEISPLIYETELGVVRLNEKIAKVCASLPNCFEVPQCDVFPHYIVENGRTDYHPLHPVAKEPLAVRLELLVRANLFENRSLRAPVLKSAELGKSSSRVTFSVSSPLKCADKKVLGFYVCDEDGVFYPAEAKIISSDTVLLKHRGAGKPAGIGYAYFLYTHIANLTDSEGLPAIPFRTGEFMNEYRPLIPFLCGTDKTPVEGFYPQNGGYFEKPAWKNGELFSSPRAKVRMSNGMPVLRVVRDNSTMFFCGVSPELNASEQSANLSPYAGLRLKLKTSAPGLVFYGLNFCTVEGKFCNCVPAVGADRGAVELPQGTSEQIVDLTRVFACIGIDTDREGLSKIRSMQFTFCAPESGYVRICAVEYLKELPGVRRGGKRPSVGLFVS